MLVLSALTQLLSLYGLASSRMLLRGTVSFKDVLDEDIRCPRVYIQLIASVFINHRMEVFIFPVSGNYVLFQNNRIIKTAMVNRVKRFNPITKETSLTFHYPMIPIKHWYLSPWNLHKTFRISTNWRVDKDTQAFTSSVLYCCSYVNTLPCCNHPFAFNWKS